MLLFKVNSDESGATYELKFGHGRLTDFALFRSDNHEVATHPFGHLENRGYPFALFNGDQVNEVFAFGGATDIGQFVSLKLEDASPVGKEEQPIMAVSH